MTMFLNIPLSLSGDRELKGRVNESLIKHYFSKVLQPSSIHLVRLDASVGSGSYVDLSAAASSNLPETVKVYSAKIDGRSLPDKWIVPNTSDDVTEHNNFKNHLIAQGFLFV